MQIIESLEWVNSYLYGLYGNIEGLSIVYGV
jgi:hypothetical protein